MREAVAPVDELREVLTTSSLLGDARWDEAVVRDLVAELETVVVHSGDVVIRRGEASDDLLLVVNGRLRVVLEQPDGGETVLSEFGRGETVGEMGLITGDPRSATVYAIRDAILARLSRASFDALCARHPHAMIERFAGGTVRRLLSQTQGERAPVAAYRGAVALIAADAGVPLGTLVEALAGHLERLGPTLTLTSAGCDAMVGRDGASSAALRAEDEAMLVRILAEHERANRFLLYDAGREPSAWSERCVRQCDHVVVVARAAETPRDVAILTSARGGPEARRRTSLVLLHEGTAVQPGAAARWRAHVAADDVYHLRPGSGEDTGRLARLIAGEGVSLVIGGGGARAFAALGVARALGEIGTPIDTVCGVSAGAVVGALVAMGLSYDEAIARCAAVARRVDYTVPVYALTTGRNWSATLTDLFETTDIDDLVLPFFCTSVNLSQARLVVHDSGALLHATRASTAIPGILPPVWHDGDLLVDGGLLNNLPIDLARSRRGVGRVLAVSFTPERRREHRQQFGYHVSGWRALGARLVRRPRPDMPTTMNLLMRSMLVGEAQTMRDNVRLASWIFRPPARGHSLMDWRRFRGIADAGYRYAAEALQQDDVRAAVLGEPARSS
jgi:predicted acylesterase/phospholipase RssA/CRP-like cAMP-binding protein